MDVLRVIILKEASQIMKDKYQINIIRYHLYVKTLKNIQINLLKKKKKQTDVENKVTVTKSRRRREG